jgi:RHS repeat-associated protein
MATTSGASGYDSLNRLIAAQASTGPYQGLQAAWNYDSFGNRTAEGFSLGSGANVTAPIPASTVVTPSVNNQIQSVQMGTTNFAPTYDQAGDVKTDPGSGNRYLYDGEGRVCAVSGPGGTTGYVYDADGNRVAKGTLTQFTCDLNPADSTYNGFMAANNETDYVLGPGGEQVTELAQDANGTMNWQRTYVYAGSALIGTYDPSPDTGQPAVSFRLTDWLGTMRATTDSSGVLQSTCTGLPFGDSLACSGNIPDPHYFTGKERDQESGNDYFGARYYASSMGRFMSPDPSQLYYADPTNPQGLNLYSYALNNPLKNTDQTGLYCTYFKSDFGNYNDVESVDNSGQYDASKYSSGYDECASNGGQWTEVSSVEVNADDSNGNLSTTSDTSNVQITQGQDPKSTVVDCVGIGRGIQGISGPFPSTSGHGAYNFGKNPIPVTAGTAAVIPSQFHFQNNVAMKPFVGEISGTVGTNSFSSVTDTIDNKQSPIPGMSTRDAFQKLNPGKLIVEVAGAPKDVGANALVNVVVPQSVGCPANTSEAQ